MTAANDKYICTRWEYTIHNNEESLLDERKYAIDEQENSPKNRKLHCVQLKCLLHTSLNKYRVCMNVCVCVYSRASQWMHSIQCEKSSSFGFICLTCLLLCTVYTVHGLTAHNFQQAQLECLVLFISLVFIATIKIVFFNLNLQQSKKMHSTSIFIVQ